MASCFDMLWSQTCVDSLHDSSLNVCKAWGFAYFYFSEVTWQNPAVNVQSMLNSEWSLLVSQTAGMCNTTLTIISALWPSGEVRFEGNTKASCWHFVVMWQSVSSSCEWIANVCSKNQQCLTNSTPLKKQALNWISQHLRNCARPTMRFRLSPSRCRHKAVSIWQQTVISTSDH